MKLALRPLGFCLKTARYIRALVQLAWVQILSLLPVHFAPAAGAPSNSDCIGRRFASLTRPSCFPNLFISVTISNFFASLADGGRPLTQHVFPGLRRAYRGHPPVVGHLQVLCCDKPIPAGLWHAAAPNWQHNTIGATSAGRRLDSVRSLSPARIGSLCRVWGLT